MNEYEETEEVDVKPYEAPSEVLPQHASDPQDDVEEVDNA